MLKRAQQRGAEGVGLYCSEVAFMGLHLAFLAKAEQVLMYREQLEALYPLPVTMRTLDIGGDKPLKLLSHQRKQPLFRLAWHSHHPRSSGNIFGASVRHD